MKPLFLHGGEAVPQRLILFVVIVEGKARAARLGCVRFKALVGRHIEDEVCSNFLGGRAFRDDDVVAGADGIDDHACIVYRPEVCIGDVLAFELGVLRLRFRNGSAAVVDRFDDERKCSVIGDGGRLVADGAEDGRIHETHFSGAGCRGGKVTLFQIEPVAVCHKERLPHDDLVLCAAVCVALCGGIEPRVLHHLFRRFQSLEAAGLPRDRAGENAVAHPLEVVDVVVYALVLCPPGLDRVVDVGGNAIGDECRLGGIDASVERCACGIAAACPFDIGTRPDALGDRKELVRRIGLLKAELFKDGRIVGDARHARCEGRRVVAGILCRAVDVAVGFPHGIEHLVLERDVFPGDGLMIDKFGEVGGLPLRFAQIRLKVGAHDHIVIGAVVFQPVLGVLLHSVLAEGDLKIGVFLFYPRLFRKVVEHLFCPTVAVAEIADIHFQRLRVARIDLPAAGGSAESGACDQGGGNDRNNFFHRVFLLGCASAFETADSKIFHDDIGKTSKYSKNGDHGYDESREIDGGIALPRQRS